MSHVSAGRKHKVNLPHFFFKAVDYFSLIVLSLWKRAWEVLYGLFLAFNGHHIFVTSMVYGQFHYPFSVCFFPNDCFCWIHIFLGSSSCFPIAFSSQLPFPLIFDPISNEIALFIILPIIFSVVIH